MARVLRSGVSVFAALALVLLSAAPLGAQSLPPSNSSNPLQGISVVGTGIVLAQPTIGRVTLGVEVTNLSLAQALSDSTSRMNAVIQRVKAAGVADADIRTVSFNVNPQYDNGSLRGYMVQNLVEVRIADLTVLGGLLDDAVAAGATRVYSVRFEATDPSALHAQARDQAMQDARGQAEQLARDAGVSLGRVISIEESDAGDVTPVAADQRTLAAAPAASASASAPVPVQAGQLQVRTVVRVVWATQ